MWAQAGAAGPVGVGGGSRMTLWAILVTGSVGLIELRRRHQHLLLGNLGVGQGTLFCVACAPALLAEIALGVLR